MRKKNLSPPPPPPDNFSIFCLHQFIFVHVGNSIKPEENMKYWKQILIFYFVQYLKNSYKMQTAFHQYQKLYSTLPWHGARTCKVSSKYINAFSSYSAKTKHDGQTDGQTRGEGNCNISRPGPSVPREIGPSPPPPYSLRRRTSRHLKSSDATWHSEANK